jgi:caa(3)-type oxidase subunit IV
MADHTHGSHGQEHGHAHAHAHPHGQGDGHGHEEHIHEASHYIRIWAILVGLFIISVLGPMLEIKWLTLITAFGIATVKASMVVHYFMHLSVEKRFVHYFLATSLAFMFLFFFAVAPDVMKHSGTGWVNVAAQEQVAAGLAAGDGHDGHGEGDHGEHGPTDASGQEHGKAPAEHAPAQGGH